MSGEVPRPLSAPQPQVFCHCPASKLPLAEVSCKCSGKGSLRVSSPSLPWSRRKHKEWIQEQTDPRPNCESQGTEFTGLPCWKKGSLHFKVLVLRRFECKKNIFKTCFPSLSALLGQFILKWEHLHVQAPNQFQFGQKHSSEDKLIFFSLKEIAF